MKEQEQQPVKENEKTCILSQEIVELLKRMFPEQFFGTKEWDLRVQQEAREQIKGK